MPFAAPIQHTASLEFPKEGFSNDAVPGSRRMNSIDEQFARTLV